MIPKAVRLVFPRVSGAACRGGKGPRARRIQPARIEPGMMAATPRAPRRTSAPRPRTRSTRAPPDAGRSARPLHAHTAQLAPPPMRPARRPRPPVRPRRRPGPLVAGGPAARARPPGGLVGRRTAGHGPRWSSGRAPMAGAEVVIEASDGRVRVRCAARRLGPRRLDARVVARPHPRTDLERARPVARTSTRSSRTDPLERASGEHPHRRCRAGSCPWPARARRRRAARRSAAAARADRPRLLRRDDEPVPVAAERGGVFADDVEDVPHVLDDGARARRRRGSAGRR